MNDYTPTYILTWNPKVFQWDNYEEVVDIVRNRPDECSWSCRSKKPKENDRFILLMQGMSHKNGIVGVGEILSEPYELPFADYGGRFLDIRFTKMWNYKEDKYILTDDLKKLFPEQCFSPQFSGIRVRSSILPELWKVIKGE